MSSLAIRRNKFAKDLASALGLAASDVEIVDVRAGSIIVKFKVKESSKGAAQRELAKQLSNPSSKLNTVMAQVDSKHPLAGTGSMKTPKKKSSTKASARAARAARSRSGSRARLSQLKRGSKSAVTSPRSSKSSVPKPAVEQKQSKPNPVPTDG